MAGAGSAEKLNKNGAGVDECEPQKDVFWGCHSLSRAIFLFLLQRRKNYGIIKL